MGLIRLVCIGWLVCAFGYLALMPIGFGIAMLTQDDRPPPRYLYTGDLK